ncbi:unnamed protein product [Ilex paraguariensis]|uniref:UvrD-like helicase C-terminal domain-containing protein n=1 Tax=Ilex paraguariensis TaxID=185542 RepID=A0ABC8R9V6_9AQUA
MKTEHGDFDLADLVIDLHHRLKNEKLEGDKMDFVYIDEVQDLTIKQIALFKYICRNIDEGFVFSGDTAQTIAQGIDFRFEDIRSLFYNDFILQSVSDESTGRKEKGLISEIFNLRQNFRTHAGVLKLAQSVIDLLCHFFRNSIDILKPETSLIYGEAPVLLEPGNEENAIVTIFGNSGNVDGKIVGFGAEQVILVRDDSARMEISDYIGKQALVLTIMECKGLEFQDVLLYNFFGSSPLRNQWRVVYEFMKKQDLLDSTISKSPSFSHAKHNILCSELKQLYVAITRTRQRLWICENIEELSKPMFDYWKRKCLVQVRKLDDSLAQAMQVASSPEEWKARGLKLYWETNYEMATMCFERAGDTISEKRAKAAGLKAAADRLRVSNPEMSCTVLREAAEIFDSIGRAESAAECFCDLGEYERAAGNIYMEKCGVSELKKAGECFSLAGFYERAAHVYAKGNYLQECLSVCTQGKFFDLGLQFIEYWKQLSTMDDCMAARSKDVDKIEKEFLERCALHYYELKDNRSMMKFVRAFHSMDLRRNFLKSLECLDELLLLEEESGNFVEAAEIAELRGDLLLEADLLGKARHFKEASLLILWYVFSKSLWAPNSRGWPLKLFTQKEELLSKAKLFAKKESDCLYEFVCTEVEVLSHEKANLFRLKQNFNASQCHKSLRGEILTVWKILDAHVHLNTSKYDWEDEVPVDLRKHSKEMISQNRVSLQTLVYFWNLWKENIVNIFYCLAGIETATFDDYMAYEAFCSNYFGVRRQLKSQNIIYIVLNPDANWLRQIDDRSSRRIGKLVYADARHFVSAARNHWRSELLSVGMKMLQTLDALHKFSTRNSLSVFCQSMSLLHIFEVAKFLKESKFLDCKYHDTRALESFIQLSTKYFVGIFPLDSRKSLAGNMIYLRRTELSRSLLEEVVHGNINGKLTYGQIGRVVMMWLGSGKPTEELYKKIEERFKDNSSWKTLVQNLSGNIMPESSEESPSSISDEAPRAISLICKFHKALENAYNANWRKENDYISPSCFLYLVDRLLILAFNLQGFFLTTKSSTVEWLIYQQWMANPAGSSATDFQSSLGSMYDFVVSIIQHFLYNRQDTEEWIKKSKINFKYYYPLLVTRLVSILCLVCVNSGRYFDILPQLLGRGNITSQLPKELCGVLQRMRKGNGVNVNANVLAEAFKRIGDPLVIVSLRINCANFFCPDAILVDMGVTQCREDIIRVLFPRNTKAPQGQMASAEVDMTNSCKKGISLNGKDGSNVLTVTSSNFAPMEDQNLNTNDQDLKINWGIFQEISDAVELVESRKDGNLMKFVSNASKMKEQVKRIRFFWLEVTMSARRVSDKKPCASEDGNLSAEANNVLEELEQLSSALDVSDPEHEKNLSSIGELSRRLQSRLPWIETAFSIPLVSHKDTNVSTVSDPQYHREADNSKSEEIGKSEEGNTKDLQATAASEGQTNAHNEAVGSSKGKRNKKSRKGKKGKGGRKR